MRQRLRGMHRRIHPRRHSCRARRQPLRVHYGGRLPRFPERQRGLPRHAWSRRLVDRKRDPAAELSGPRSALPARWRLALRRPLQGDLLAHQRRDLRPRTGIDQRRTARPREHLPPRQHHRRLPADQPDPPWRHPRQRQPGRRVERLQPCRLHGGSPAHPRRARRRRGPLRMERRPGPPRDGAAGSGEAAE